MNVLREEKTNRPIERDGYISNLNNTIYIPLKCDELRGFTQYGPKLYELDLSPDCLTHFAQKPALLTETHYKYKKISIDSKLEN